MFVWWVRIPLSPPMNLATQLREGKYKLPPLPRPLKPESEAQKRKRKFKRAKDDFFENLNKEIRKYREKKWKRPEFLDVYLNYWEFPEMFDSHKNPQYHGGAFEYTLKQESWFVDYLRWLKAEGFKVEGINLYQPHDPDEQDSYSIRVRW